MPGGVGTRGEGVVVAVVDTGSNAAHPSFADDATCGFGIANHKLLSTVDCMSTDAGGLCNGEDPEAEPGNGHGVHTASTAAGNRIDSTAIPPPTLPPQHDAMSGVAPCAHVRTYKVCPDSGCSDAAIAAAVENAIVDQVDVVNFSIGPTCGSIAGESPWSDGETIWLDALAADIFVATSAGNTRAGCTDPAGRVSNIGPWVTTVAASTHDENVYGVGLLDATGPGTPPAGTHHVLLFPGSGLDVGVPMSNVEVRDYPANPIGCTVNGGFPPGYFSGTAALIERGNCTFEEKIENAAAAGAVLAIIYNNQDGLLQRLRRRRVAAGVWHVAAGRARVRRLHRRERADRSHCELHARGRAGRRACRIQPARSRCADRRSRSPTCRHPASTSTCRTRCSRRATYGYPQRHLDVVAARRRLGGAGAGDPSRLDAVSEVKSALMLTAFNAGTEENLTTPWTADDVGAGRVDLTRAALAGFVMDETATNYFAADPASGGDPTTLNLATMRNVGNCSTPNPCAWTRTLRDALPLASSWTVSVNAPSGVTVDVVPTTYTLAGTGDSAATEFHDGFDAMVTQTLSVTAMTEVSAARSAICRARVPRSERRGTGCAYVGRRDRDGRASRGAVGVTCSGAARCAFQVDVLTSNFSGIGCDSYCGMLWVNRFTPDPTDYPITITSISVLFGNISGWNGAGDHVNFYVYQDDDADPTNGAMLAGAYQGYTMPAPVNDFVTITLPVPIVVNGPGDVLIALTNPAPNVGTRPASADIGPFAGRSWLASFDDIGTAPDLAAAGLLLNTDAIEGFSGNWLIRASGTNAGGRPIELGPPAKN